MELQVKINLGICVSLPQEMVPVMPKVPGDIKHLLNKFGDESLALLYSNQHMPVHEELQQGKLRCLEGAHCYSFPPAVKAMND
eukprot:13064155-Ditylum_brightwellii.AAC.1